MTCRATYANRPRTREDERKTAKIVVQLPYAEIARAAYHRGLEKRDQLLAQAPQRVRRTVTVIARDAWMFGVAVGLLAGVAIGHWVRL